MAAEESTGRRRHLIAGYANYFEVGHNAYEFLIDFGQVDPQSGDVNFSNRIAVGPTQAKIFAELMEDAVHQFERENGAIPDLDDGDPLGALLDSASDFPHGVGPPGVASSKRQFAQSPVTRSKKR